MTVIDYWDIHGNFWKANPQLTVHPVLKDLMKKDKSRGKKDSSQKMWAVALYADFDSKFRSLHDIDRRKLICDEYLENPNYDWEKLEELVEVWEDFQSPMRKQMLIWERVMLEKNEYMKTLNYKDNGDELEKKLKSNSDLYEEFERLKSKLDEEQDAGHVKGGAMESLSELGEI